jgi:hypothetical protein
VDGESSTVHELRARWKPIKERLKADEHNQPILIRLHRCFSWLQCAEDASGADDLDSRLIHQWIAFNALYGRWNVERREPEADRPSWHLFLDRIAGFDQGKTLQTVLVKQRKLVMAILDDAYLTTFFWEDPSEERARKSKKTKFDARTWYVEAKYDLLLRRVMERVYLLRCQLVHGAATHDGQLNRKSLHRCVSMLGHITEAIVSVTMDHGADEDWGPLCYPPFKPQFNMKT